MTHAFVLQGRQNLYICGIFEQSTSLLKLPNENLTNGGKKPKKQQHKIFCWTAEVQCGLFFFSVKIIDYLHVSHAWSRSSLETD